MGEILLIYVRERIRIGVGTYTYTRTILYSPLYSPLPPFFPNPDSASLRQSLGFVLRTHPMIFLVGFFNIVNFKNFVTMVARAYARGFV